MWNLFKKKVSIPARSPRDLYHADLVKRFNEADEIFVFLTIAMRRGFPVTMHFEVDGQMSPLFMEIGGEPGGAVEWMATYAAGVKLKNQGRLDQLHRDWDRVGPSLGEWDPGEDEGPNYCEAEDWP